MKKALFPGSFNPFHAGHREVYYEASKVFDVTVGRFANPDKNGELRAMPKDIEWVDYTGRMVTDLQDKYDVIIKGLRNGDDLEYEAAQQYWNVQLGLFIPVLYIVTSPELRYISSSALRTIEKLKG